MLKPAPFRAEHLLSLGTSAEPDRISTKRLVEYAVMYEKHPSISFVDGSTIIACGGLFIPWEGLAEAWFRTVPACAQYRRELFRLTKRALELSVRALGLRRVDATLCAGFEAGRVWVEHLGFRKESELPNFGPNGERFVRYVWLTQPPH